VNAIIADPFAGVATSDVGALGKIAATAVVTAEVPTAAGEVVFVAVTTERMYLAASVAVST
jgi:hypothetical protein